LVVVVVPCAVGVGAVVPGLGRAWVDRGVGVVAVGVVGQVAGGLQALRGGGGRVAEAVAVAVDVPDGVWVQAGVGVVAVGVVGQVARRLGAGAGGGAGVAVGVAVGVGVPGRWSMTSPT
jgi:hypothetical protein